MSVLIHFYTIHQTLLVSQNRRDCFWYNTFKANICKWALFWLAVRFFFLSNPQIVEWDQFHSHPGSFWQFLAIQGSIHALQTQSFWSCLQGVNDWLRYRASGKHSLIWLHQSKDPAIPLHPPPHAPYLPPPATVVMQHLSTPPWEKELHLVEKRPAAELTYCFQTRVEGSYGWQRVVRMTAGLFSG